MHLWLSIICSYLLFKGFNCYKEELIVSEHPIKHEDCPRLDDNNHPILLAHPNDCRRYYSCLDGFAYPKMCPENLHWSAVTYRCDYPEIAKCETEANIDNQIANANNFKSKVYFQNHPSDCNRFVQCQIMKCPPNYHWNAKTERCDFPHLAQCENYPPSSNQSAGAATASTPPSSGNQENGVTSPGWPAGNDTQASSGHCAVCDALCDRNDQMYLPFPGNCHKFIQCNGIAFIFNCPDHLYWNAKLNACDRICVPN
ncbi:peritrophin-1-like [Glossina fuscipes]|uniref:Peritrophin-1-like n=1 Tax=Glossina fuscipes TaxID=7396 RepID=A0A9C5ZPR8_9MUSC|nr:peritrophin-1-like [Glossina fuscipes]